MHAISLFRDLLHSFGLSLKQFACSVNFARNLISELIPVSWHSPTLSVLTVWRTFGTAHTKTSYVCIYCYIFIYIYILYLSVSTWVVKFIAWGYYGTNNCCPYKFFDKFIRASQLPSASLLLSQPPPASTPHDVHYFSAGAQLNSFFLALGNFVCSNI